MISFNTNYLYLTIGGVYDHLVIEIRIPMIIKAIPLCIFYAAGILKENKNKSLYVLFGIGFNITFTFFLFKKLGLHIFYISIYLEYSEVRMSTSNLAWSR